MATTPASRIGFSPSNGHHTEVSVVPTFVNSEDYDVESLPNRRLQQSAELVSARFARIISFGRS